MSGPSQVRTAVSASAYLSPTIANGASKSAAIDLGGNRLCGVEMPAAWTAAGLAFEVSVDGTNYFPMYAAGGAGEYAVTVAASRFVLIPKADFIGIRYLKIVSGTNAVAVAQGALRTFKLLVAP